MTRSPFDPTRYKWRKVVGGPEYPYEIRHDYTILGYDTGAGTLDMLVRWPREKGHCQIHRHVATTTVLVLEGEQHLWDIHPDGSRGVERVRRAGDYALSTGDALPHLECGGPEGGIAFFGTHARDGVLYEILGPDLKPLVDVTIELLVADWKANS